MNEDDLLNDEIIHTEHNEKFASDDDLHDENDFDEKTCDEEDEYSPPINEECEYCGAPATTWVQDHPACEDCFTSAYEKYIYD